MSEGLGDGCFGGEDDGVGCHHPAGGVFVVGEESAHIACFLWFHGFKELGSLVVGELMEEVGGVVRLHEFKDVGGTFCGESRQDRDLVVFGEFLEHVGESGVVQCGCDFDASYVAKFVE